MRLSCVVPLASETYSHCAVFSGFTQYRFMSDGQTNGRTTIAYTALAQRRAVKKTRVTGLAWTLLLLAAAASVGHYVITPPDSRLSDTTVAVTNWRNWSRLGARWRCRQLSCRQLILLPAVKRRLVRFCCNVM